MKDIINVQIYPAGKTVHVAPGSALKDLLDEAGLALRLPCGGQGRCGKCKTIFREGAPVPTATELDRLTEDEISQGLRLGCMTVLHDDAVIHLPSSESAKAAKILTTGVVRDVPVRPAVIKKHVQMPKPSTEDLRSDLRRVLDALGIDDHQKRLDLSVLRSLGKDIRDAGYDLTGVLIDGEPVAFEPGDTSTECYGVALDVGTTTLASYLIDLHTGKQLAVAAAINPQTRIGDDVISRISYTSEESDGLDRLQTAVIAEFNKLIKNLASSAGIPVDSIYEVTMVGNTCMTHLFLGIDPQHLAQAPYVPTVSQSVCIDASTLGIEINPKGRVYVLPCIAGYVGADTVGVVLSTGVYEDDEMILAVDIGTNGEIVLGTKDRMLSCSTAAGPAFEGAHIKYGMRAAPGAIDSAWLDENGISFSTINGAKAVGICGSGLLDVIICMFNAGIIESSGRIVDSEEVPEAYAHLRERMREGEKGNEYILATAEQTSIGEPVVVTQRDVREIQLAKGAIAAGITTLMERMGIGVDGLDRVVLAGAFGNYIRKESAIAAGMLPAVPLSKVHSVGNAAGEGAKLSLISLDAREDVDRIADSVEYVELTTDFGFQEKFADALMFGSGSQA